MKEFLPLTGRAAAAFAITVGVLGSGLFGLSTSPAEAAMVCKHRDTVLEKLSSHFREAPVAMGLASNGSVLEVLTSGEGKSWTIIQTRADGVSCILATGESWQPTAWTEPAPNDPKS